MNVVIEKTLMLIKEQTGVELYVDPDYGDLKQHAGKEYFNAELTERISESHDYEKLKAYCHKYPGGFSVAPNGYKRIAVYTS